MYEREKGKQPIKRADIFIIGICLATAAILAVYFWMLRDEGERRLLQISYDGEVMVSLNLEEYISPKDTVYYLFLYENDGVLWESFREYPDIPGDVSFNLLCVTSEEIRMEAADCRDQICVNHRPISGGGESIVCLPHRLVVEIVGGRDSEALDGMVK